VWPQRGKWLRFRALRSGAIDERDTNGVAIDPGQLAVAIGESHRRQHEEKLRQLQSGDGIDDRQFGAAFSDVLDDAIAPPGAVDRHHLRGTLVIKPDARARSLFALTHIATPAIVAGRRRPLCPAGRTSDEGWRSLQR
jgi:hypothetical protein